MSKSKGFKLSSNDNNINKDNKVVDLQDYKQEDDLLLDGIIQETLEEYEDRLEEEIMRLLHNNVEVMYSGFGDTELMQRLHQSMDSGEEIEELDYFLETLAGYNLTLKLIEKGNNDELSIEDKGVAEFIEMLKGIIIEGNIEMTEIKLLNKTALLTALLPRIKGKLNSLIDYNGLVNIFVNNYSELDKILSKIEIKEIYKLKGDVEFEKHYKGYLINTVFGIVLRELLSLNDNIVDTVKKEDEVILVNYVNMLNNFINGMSLENFSYDTNLEEELSKVIKKYYK